VRCAIFSVAFMSFSLSPQVSPGLGIFSLMENIGRYGQHTQILSTPSQIQMPNKGICAKL
ncbi:hypothetical protein, partial [Moraxella catarrhalis]|uniref:hypothetical protein n=1 Tax=Moraxella catarrhalis TaxID=480 RepID=UPI001D0DBB73